MRWQYLPVIIFLMVHLDSIVITRWCKQLHTLGALKNDFELYTCARTSCVGCHFMHLTSWVWCNKTLAHSYSSPSSSISHTHTLLSLLQVARYVPHFDHDTHFTSFSCPSNVLLHWKSEGLRTIKLALIGNKSIHQYMCIDPHLMKLVSETRRATIEFTEHVPHRCYILNEL